MTVMSKFCANALISEYTYADSANPPTRKMYLYDISNLNTKFGS
jgi:hypothetical protein